MSDTETRDDIERDIHSSTLENANENNSFEELVGEESQPLEHEQSALITQLKESLQEMENKLACTKDLLERRISELERELKEEREFRMNLEQNLSASIFNIDNIKKSDKLFKFYTGFQNYEVFSKVLNFLGREAASKLDYGNKERQGLYLKEKPGPQRALSVEDEFFSFCVVVKWAYSRKIWLVDLKYPRAL